MPDISHKKDLSPTHNAKEKAATSKPYRGHPTLTVKEYLKLDMHQQREVDREREQALGIVRTTVTPPDGPPYTVGKSTKSQP